MPTNKFFNAHHSPIGAFSSFTFGCNGPLGGLGIELKGPANENVFVGVEDHDGSGKFHALPFFGRSVVDNSESDDYDVEGLSDFQFPNLVFPFEDAAISRTFGPSIDTWTAGDLEFRVISRVGEVPEPTTEFDENLKQAITPSVLIELTIDNQRGTHSRKAFFGYAGSASSSGMRTWRDGDIVGIAQGTATCIATADEGVYAGVAWQPEAVLVPRSESNLDFILGSTGLLVGHVAAGEKRTFRFSMCFFREGTATTGIVTRYYYRRFFETIEEVARYALDNFDASLAHATAVDAHLGKELSPDRRLMLSHAIRSYFGATQLLQKKDGSPLWVVNEGEYRMMNTFDLTVDQAFFELAMNPWTVKNELDLFVSSYSYEDQLRFPNDDTLHPGGIAFTHDMGIANTFSRTGYSGYEQAGLTGVFSYMSCEELVNWILTACMYQHRTGDSAWVKANRATFVAVAKSLINRDHPDASKRNGVMSLDSSRCEGGAEITTYDSLDTSLGQARDNLYLAVKCWAAYVMLEPILAEFGDASLAAEMSSQAAKCAKTVQGAADADGYLPALVEGGGLARIIPAIEGLVYPFLAGHPDAVSPTGPFRDLRACLEKHFDLVLSSGQCRFSDGGWRLSSTSRNSWLSKIYLCQFVAEHVLGRDEDTAADAAHLAWLMSDDNVYFAWSDQMVEGKAAGSRYYPRGVTSILWTLKGKTPSLSELRSELIPDPAILEFSQ